MFCVWDNYMAENGSLTRVFRDDPGRYREEVEER